MFPRTTQTLPTTDLLIVDLETQGLQALTDNDVQIYFAVTLEVRGASNTLRVWYSMLELCSYIDSHPELWLIFHNSKFDYRILKQRGLQASVERVLDTQVLSYVLDNTRSSYSLDALTGRKLDIQAEFIKQGILESRVKPEQFWAIDWSDDEVAMELLTDYCKQDCRATYWLYKTLASKLYASGVSAYFCVLQPMLDVLIMLEQHGASVDRSKLLQLRDNKQAAVVELEQQITKRVGLLPKLKWNETEAVYEPFVKTYARGTTRDKRATLPHYIDNNGVIVTSWEGHRLGDKLEVGNHCPLVPFNQAAATGHVWWLVYHHSKKLIKGAKKTKAANKPQLNKDYIKKIEKQLPDWFPIAELNKQVKALTIAESLLKHLQADNRIYPTFSHTRTLTGRLACSKPNLQNIPRVGKKDKVEDVNFRSLFVAPTGFTYLCADLNFS